eukprot:Skav228172  [mRNA]  locus=scaffold1728:22897:31783:+ [translate_table: standard]
MRSVATKLLQIPLFPWTWGDDRRCQSSEIRVPAWKWLLLLPLSLTSAYQTVLEEGSDELSGDWGWRTVADLFEGNVKVDDDFGKVVSISGGSATVRGCELLIVGAPGEDFNGTDAGAAYVYVLCCRRVTTSNVWALDARLVSSDIAAGDRFGNSVKASGAAVERTVARGATDRSTNLLLPTSSADWRRDLQMDHDGYQKKLGVIIKRLKDYLKLQKWPTLTHVEVEGQRFKLPVRLRDLHSDFISELAKEADDRYFAGFFDGDGCVTAQSNLSGCALILAQSTVNARVLFQFLARHGGSICAENPGRGSTSPTIVWRAYGQSAQQAASILFRHCLVKREQLRIVISWPSRKDEREVCHKRLGILKITNPDFASDQQISWPYLAGFFDAEGCVSVDRASKAVRLDIGQRHAAILRIIQGFLLDKLPARHNSMKLYAGQNSHALVIGRTPTSIEILENLLHHGLQWKRQTAVHVLGAQKSSRSHATLRRDVGSNKGKQSYFMKLDDAGCRRARIIKNITSKLWSARQKDPSDARRNRLEEALARAKLEHQVLNAQTQIQKLRSFIDVVKKMTAVPFPNDWHQHKKTASDWVIVGADGHDDDGLADTGCFSQSVGSAAKLKGNDTMAGDKFGVSVGISDSLAVVPRS